MSTIFTSGNEIKNLEIIKTNLRECIQSKNNEDKINYFATAIAGVLFVNDDRSFLRRSLFKNWKAGMKPVAESVRSFIKNKDETSYKNMILKLVRTSNSAKSELGRCLCYACKSTDEDGESLFTDNENAQFKEDIEDGLNNMNALHRHWIADKYDNTVVNIWVVLADLVNMIHKATRTKKYDRESMQKKVITELGEQLKGSLKDIASQAENIYKKKSNNIL